MFSLDSLLHDAFPHRKTPAWQRSLLRTLLCEKEFKQFAADYPHLKGLDLIEQVVDYFSQVKERRIVYQSGINGITILGDTLELEVYPHSTEVQQ